MPQKDWYEYKQWFAKICNLSSQRPISCGIHGSVIPNLNNAYNQIVKISFIANDNVVQYNLQVHFMLTELFRVAHGFNFHLIGPRLISLDTYYHAMKRPPMSRRLLELLQKGLLSIMTS